MNIFVKNRNYHNGFTLTELIIAIGIFAVAVTVIAVFAARYFENYFFAFEENQSISQAQLGLTQMLREIREIRIGEDGAWPLIQTDGNTFAFYSDTTNDGKSDRVRYFLDNKILKRGVIEPTQVPVTYLMQNEKISTITDYLDNGTEPIFNYYDGNWPGSSINNPIPATDRILNTRYVSVNLKINILASQSAQPFELTSGVQLRNLKDNL